jgi:hypothetical protein
MFQPERSFRLFSTTVTSEFPLAVVLPQSDRAPDLTLRLSLQPLLSSDPSASNRLYSSPFHDKDGASLGCLYRAPEGEILRFSGAGDFLVLSDRIEGFSPDWSNGLAELRFLGPVLSYWFERRGLPAFHASAVSVNGRAVAFASRHGGGKSGLAAGMIAAGAALLTDDLLVLEERNGLWEVRPSYPQMRMWPDEAEHFLGSFVDLPLVQRDSEKRSVAVGEGGFGTFLDVSTPLACIYLPTRVEGADAVEIQPLSRSEALIELVRHSFSPRLMEAAGLQPARLDHLARLVRSVPVRRLVYPSGFERLGEVAGELLQQAARGARKL